MPSRAETEFHRGMVEGSARLTREIGYNPSRFLQMVGELGGPEAVRRLLGSPDTSEGFTTLWEAGRLEMSCEATALLPWYEELFTDEQLGVARRRLAAHHFDIDGFLRRRRATPPPWWDGGGP